MAQVTDDLPGKQHEIDEAAIKAQLIAQHKQNEVKKSDFPTEIIDLPSKGLLYPEGHPLANGTIEMKYMTAKEEDILSSSNLLRKGMAIDKLLESLIVTPVNYQDLLVGDKNAIMYAARVLGYGKDYQVKYTCPECSEDSKLNVDLTQLKDKEVDYTLYNRENKFEFTLPRSNRSVTFKLLTHHDEELIQTELKALQTTTKQSGIDRSASTRIKHIITSVDGNTDKTYIRNFVDNELFALDAQALRKHIISLTPDVDTDITYTCTYCGHIEEDSINIDVDFFWPGA